MKIKSSTSSAPPVLSGRAIISRVYEGKEAPHARTLRGTYTVPANKRAILYHTRLMAFVQALPTTDELYRASVELNIGGIGGIVLDQISSDDAAQDVIMLGETHLKMMLEPTDILQLYTEDLSTGGNYVYSLNFFCLEFDG